MALTNQQYESIIKEYELIQTRNRHKLQKREEEIFEKIPEYANLSASAGALSVSCVEELLSEVSDSDASDSASPDAPSPVQSSSALDRFRSRMASVSAAKKALLLSHGYPQDYLDPIYNCSLCRDTGYLPADVKESSFDQSDGLLASGRRKCKCFRQKEISLLYEQSNIQQLIERENFSTLSLEYYEGEDRKRFQEAVRISLDFIQNFETDYQNLFFYGTVGTGKSFLSGCIAKELLQDGRSVIYFSALTLFDTLAKYSFDAKSKETLYNFYKDLYNCDLVIIDDLGTEVTNSFVTSQLFACLNERYLNRKATIISTNLSLEELRDRYSDRIFSRITSHFTICKLSGPDIRIYKKRMRR